MASEIRLEAFPHPYSEDPWAFQQSSVINAPRMLAIVNAFIPSLRYDGHIAEFGLFKGETLRQLTLFLARYFPEKKAYGFDTFSGLPESASEHDWGGRTQGMYACARDQVESILAGAGYYELCEVHIRENGLSFREPLCFAHIDLDLYEGTAGALATCQECLVKNGAIVVDDYGTSWRGVTLAVDEFVKKHHPHWKIATTEAVGSCVLTRN